MQGDDRKAPPNSGWIDIANPVERGYWAEKFGVTEQMLVQAVKLVGPTVPQVSQVLGQPSGDPKE